MHPNMMRPSPFPKFRCGNIPPTPSIKLAKFKTAHTIIDVIFIPISFKKPYLTLLNVIQNIIDAIAIHVNTTNPSTHNTRNAKTDEI